MCLPFVVLPVLPQQLCESGIGFVNGFGALVEECFFFVVEIEFNDLFDAVTTEDTRHADAEIFFAVFAVEERRARDEFLLITEDRAYNLSCCCTGRIPC